MVSSVPCTITWKTNTSVRSDPNVSAHEIQHYLMSRSSNRPEGTIRVHYLECIEACIHCLIERLVSHQNMFGLSQGNERGVDAHLMRGQYVLNNGNTKVC
jgi:hypothetical protein